MESLTEQVKLRREYCQSFMDVYMADLLRTGLFDRCALTYNWGVWSVSSAGDPLILVNLHSGYLHRTWVRQVMVLVSRVAGSYHVNSND